MIDEQFLQTVPRYGIGGFVGKIFKKVKDTVKKVAPIAGAGIGFMLGGSAGAGIGSGIGSLIAGKSVGESLRNAALGYGIGSIAGRFGPLQQFAGRGIGGRFAFGDQFNVLNKLLPKAAETVTADGGMTLEKFVADKGLNPSVLEDESLRPLIEKEFVKASVKEGAAKTTSGLLGKAATAAAVGAPIATYLSAKAAEENYVPTDPYALNPFYYSDPQQFQVSGIGTKPYYMNDMQNYFGIPREDLPTDFIRAKDGGGISKLANGSRMEFPRKTGAINGPGTGTSDDIPAMLSDGEFVFTAKAVRNAGGGDRRAGAKRMYQMMKNLEKGGTLSPQSRGVAA
jgi:hypothetical protein